MESGFFDVMLLTETKIQWEVYSHNCLGYDVTCLAARPSSARFDKGGVGLVIRERPVGWGIEPRAEHGKLQDFTWTLLEPTCWRVTTPSTLEHLTDSEEAMQCFRYPIFLGDLNVDLDKERILRSQQVADFLTKYGIIDLVRHFRQRRRFLNLKTWSQV